MCLEREIVQRLSISSFLKQKDGGGQATKLFSDGTLTCPATLRLNPFMLVFLSSFLPPPPRGHLAVSFVLFFLIRLYKYIYY